MTYLKICSDSKRDGIKGEHVIFTQAYLRSRQMRANYVYVSASAGQIWSWGQGGEGDLKKCAYLWKNPAYAPGMGRKITLLTVKRPVSSIFGMLYPRFRFSEFFLFQNEWLKAAFFFSKTFKTRQGFLAISHRFFICSVRSNSKNDCNV